MGGQGIAGTQYDEIFHNRFHPFQKKNSAGFPGPEGALAVFLLRETIKREQREALSLWKVSPCLPQTLEMPSGAAASSGGP